MRSAVASSAYIGSAWQMGINCRNLYADNLHLQGPPPRYHFGVWGGGGRRVSLASSESSRSRCRS